MTPAFKTMGRPAFRKSVFPALLIGATALAGLTAGGTP